MLDLGNTNINFNSDASSYYFYFKIPDDSNDFWLKCSPRDEYFIGYIFLVPIYYISSYNLIPKLYQSCNFILMIKVFFYLLRFKWSLFFQLYIIEIKLFFKSKVLFKKRTTYEQIN